MLQNWKLDVNIFMGAELGYLGFQTGLQVGTCDTNCGGCGGKTGISNGYWIEVRQYSTARMMLMNNQTTTWASSTENNIKLS